MKFNMKQFVLLLLFAGFFSSLSGLLVFESLHAKKSDDKCESGNVKMEDSSHDKNGKCVAKSECGSSRFVWKGDENVMCGTACPTGYTETTEAVEGIDADIEAKKCKKDA